MATGDAPHMPLPKPHGFVAADVREGLARSSNMDTGTRVWTIPLRDFCVRNDDVLAVVQQPGQPVPTKHQGFEVVTVAEGIVAWVSTVEAAIAGAPGCVSAKAAGPVEMLVMQPEVWAAWGLPVSCTALVPTALLSITFGLPVREQGGDKPVVVCPSTGTSE